MAIIPISWYNKYMTFVVRRYFEPFIRRILFWNVVIFICVKIVLPQSFFQSASLIDSLPVFDSREIIKLTNEARKTQSLPDLTPSPQLDKAAEDKLLDMAEKEYFAHVSPSGTTPWHWIKKNNYQYSVAGENLAIGFFTPENTVKAWLESPTHKANIMSGQYQEIGVAAKAAKIGDDQGILVVQMFGKPSDKIAPAQVPNPDPQPSLQELPAQAISTDNSLPPVKSPISVEVNSNTGTINWPVLLNNGFMIYSLLIAMISLATLVMVERNAANFAKVIFNFGLFALAVIVPVSSLTLKGLIY